MSLRDSQIGELKVPLTWTAAVALIVVGVIAVAILMSDRRETFQTEAYGATRSVSDRVLTPVGDALSAPGRWTGAGVETIRGYFFAVSENRRLKSELQEMRQWRDVAVALRDTNERYQTLLGLKTDPPIPMVAVRLVTDSRGPFANTRLANAGSEKGIKVGNPVMSEHGLVGRVIGVTNGASRVLVVTDIASRTPVMVDRTNARAILTGDGGPNPRLDYMRGIEPVRQGDRILTSGDGGLFPRGLPVGTAVKGLDGRWRVVLASDRAAIDFVRILLFEDFAQLVDAKALDNSEVPPPPAGLPPMNVLPQSISPGATAREAAARAAPATGAAPAGSTPALKPGATPPPKTTAATPAPKAAATTATPAPKTTATTATPPPKAATTTGTPPPKAAATTATPAPKTTATTPAAKTGAATTPPAKAAATSATTPAAKAATPPAKTTTPAPKAAATPQPKTATTP